MATQEGSGQDERSGQDADARDETADSRATAAATRCSRRHGSCRPVRRSSGFLLTIAFQPRFATLTAFQHVVYLVLVLAATVTTALALSPVVLHRRLFRHHAKRAVVQLGHRLLGAALVGLGVVMTGTVLLIVDVAVGVRGGTLAAVGVLLLLLLLSLVPAHLARRSRRD